MNAPDYVPPCRRHVAKLRDQPQGRVRTRRGAAFAVAIVAIAAAGIAVRADRAAEAPAATGIVASPAGASAGIYNLKVVSDASPDLSDIRSFVDSATSRWTSTEEKVWALFYWSHILKRQTPPMVLHGFDVTDPIRNLVDYGFTMCSTVSGINQTLYEVLGLRHQYWDICNHTVSAVEYNGKFHMIDSSMSNLVTTDDGVTLAGVEEAAADDARLVRERSLYSTSSNGFLSGSDAMRNLPDVVSPVDGSVSSGFADDFCAGGLKLRDYYYNWNSGHRYVLNLRDGETYTRYYRRLGATDNYWVGSEKVTSPDPAQTFEIDPTNRFGLRGNGVWSFAPDLTAAGWASAAYSSKNIAAASGGLRPAATGASSEVIYKVQAANAIASQVIHARFSRTDPAATATISVSLNHGVTWLPVGSIGAAVGAAIPVDVSLRNEVTGAYETLVRIQMGVAGAQADGILLTGLGIETITQVNAKALLTLNVGRNEISVGRGEQSDTMVLWPDLRGNLWKKDVVDSQNITAQPVGVPRRHTAVAYPAVLTQDAYLTYRMDAPSDIVQFTYGGRLHNFSAGSYIDFLHSFDGGATWVRSYRFTDIGKPWDAIHYEAVTDVPAGVRTILFKYSIHNTSPIADRASGLYAARMEVNHQPPAGASKPLDVILRWKEVRADRTTAERSHRQRVDVFPFKYVVNVGGSDHPVMESITMKLEDAADTTPLGYSDGADVGGQKYVPTRRMDGTNFATNRPYTMSRAPSGFQASAGAGNTTILTDGIVGAPATGSTSYWWGQCWTAGQDVDLQIDLGAPQTLRAFRAHLFGYPFWDALKGEVQDRIEILTSEDGATFVSRGLLQTSLWKKDIPINHMLPDDEKATAWNFERTVPAPVSARYVRYHVSPKRILCASELQALDRVDYGTFDLRIAPPGTEPQNSNRPPTIVLANPADASTVISPASLTITADATDSDGAVTRVDFLVDGAVVQSDLASPWSTVWSTTATGTHTVTARAYDNAGGMTLSPPIGITVQNPPSVPGEDVVLWAAEAAVALEWTPTPDASAAGGKRLQNADAGQPKVTAAAASPGQYFEMTFRAEAGRGYRLWIRGLALSNGTSNDSVHVQFDGSVDATGAPLYRIGTTSSVADVLEECSGCGLSGWGWQDNGWGAVGALGPLIYFQSSGLQRMRVQVREDGFGIDQIVLSSRRWLTAPPGTSKNDQTILPKTDAQQGNQPPAVALTSPPDGASFVAPTLVEITASASDPDGTVTRVDFYANDVLLGTDTTPPWGMTWSASSAGGYRLTARATDSAGASIVSAAVDLALQSGASGDDVVLYASDALTVGRWSSVADTTAAGGNRLQNADAGAAKLAAAAAIPSDYFEMTFNARAGRGYHLWIRGKAGSNLFANDSVFVQFDGSLDGTGAAAYRIGTTSSLSYNLEECTGCGLQGWGWQDNGWGSPGLAGPLIYFARDGAQRIRVQVREDGLGIDQIVLSSVRWVQSAPGAAKNDTVMLPKQ